MKTKKELLEYYGKCCVSDYCLSQEKNYPAGEKGENLAKRDNLKLANIQGQIKAIIYIFE